MELKSQVTSLELSQRLEKLGVKQASLFWWVNWSKEIHSEGAPEGWELENGPHYKGCESISAFTVAELGEILPMYLNSENLAGLAYRLFTTWNDTEGWSCAYCMPSGAGDFALQVANTEADARAKLLIYLLENNLITLLKN